MFTVAGIVLQASDEARVIANKLVKLVKLNFLNLYHILYIAENLIVWLV